MKSTSRNRNDYIKTLFVRVGRRGWQNLLVEPTRTKGVFVLGDNDD